MTLIEQINSRGHANGWHAEQLEKRAKDNGRTMAQQHLSDTAGCAAFNVCGTAVKAVGRTVTYRFKDGSEVKHDLPEKR
jgi:hypothetical protein